MNEPIQIEVSGNAVAYLKNISDPSQVLRALAKTMDRENQFTVSHIQRDYMSGPTTPTSLSVRTSRLRGSVRRRQARFANDGLESSIGSNVSYAAVHEFGCEVPSRPTRSRNKYYAKKHPVTKAYTMPERRPIRHGIEDRLDQYSQAFGETILKM